MLLNCGVGDDSWESLGLQGDPTCPSQRRSVLGVHWRDWCWKWNSNTFATWCEELTHLKRPWCWERLKVGGEGDDRGWDGWMASPTQWTWVWENSGSWWWTGRPGVLQATGLQSQTRLSDWTGCLTDQVPEDRWKCLRRAEGPDEVRKGMGLDCQVWKMTCESWVLWGWTSVGIRHMAGLVLMVTATSKGSWWSFFKKIFWCGPFFKISIKFVTLLFLRLLLFFFF